MSEKEAERELVKLIRSFGWYSHKYGDVRYCINCKAPQPKTERAPDYAIAPVFTWVECKNSSATGRWNWADDLGPEGNRVNQRQWLKENGGWLFVSLGKGRAPKGRGAWLIPWKVWESEIEVTLLSGGIKSISFEGSGLPSHKDYRPSASEYIPEIYRLEWKKGIWMIPAGHPFWFALQKKLVNLWTYIEENYG